MAAYSTPATGQTSQVKSHRLVQKLHPRYIAVTTHQ